MGGRTAAAIALGLAILLGGTCAWPAAQRHGRLQSSAVGTGGQVRDGPPGVDRGSPPLLFEAAAGIELEDGTRARLERAARAFGASLVRWLYGDRERVRIQAATPTVTSALETEPPYIPPRQRASGQGRLVALEIGMQTATSGVVTAVIADRRTSYRLPASFELRRQRWLIVQLRDH